MFAMYEPDHDVLFHIMRIKMSDIVKTLIVKGSRAEIHIFYGYFMLIKCYVLENFTSWRVFSKIHISHVRLTQCDKILNYL